VVGFRNLEARLTRFARHRWRVVFLLASISLVVSAALLPVLPVPKPAVQDEFSYLLAADTFASGRLTNPTPAFAEHFETPQVIVRPTYASKYPPLSAMAMAFGKGLLGVPWIGVWLSIGLMCGAICWALQGWLPPLWAMAGSVIALVKIGLVTYWSESYWGGSWAAIGGALAIGAAGRLARRPMRSTAVVFAAGLAILANTRPFEGLILGIACTAYVIVRCAQWKRLVVPALVCLAPVGAWMGYYNWQVTGHPLRMQYVEHEAQYVAWSPVLWATRPSYTHTYSSAGLSAFWLEADTAEKRFARDHVLKAHLSDLLDLGRFYLGWPIILCALAFARPLWRDERTRAALLLAGAFYVGAAFDARLFPHYAAPATAFAYILAGSSLRAVRRSWPGGEVERRVACVGVASVAALFAILSMPRDRFWFGAVDFHHSAKHAAVTEQLTRLPGEHLVLVRYGAGHDPYEELVYNGADIDRSKVIWARSIDEPKDAQLVRRYQDRKIWLLQEDGKVSLLLASHPGQLVGERRLFVKSESR